MVSKLISLSSSEVVFRKKATSSWRLGPLEQLKPGWELADLQRRPLLVSEVTSGQHQGWRIEFYPKSGLVDTCPCVLGGGAVFSDGVSVPVEQVEVGMTLDLGGQMEGCLVPSPSVLRSAAIDFRHGNRNEFLQADPFEWTTHSFSAFATLLHGAIPPLNPLSRTLETAFRVGALDEQATNVGFLTQSKVTRVEVKTDELVVVTLSRASSGETEVDNSLSMSTLLCGVPIGI